MIDLAPCLAADPMLPRRDVLLDPEAVADRLPGVESCAPVRVKYRIGESLRVVYRVGTGDRLVTGRMFRPSRSRTAYERALDQEPGAHRVAHDPELETVWWTFPRDRKLGDLGWLTDPDENTTRELGMPNWRRTEVVQYVPERSLTVRALAADGVTLAYGKAYGPGAVASSAMAGRYRATARALRHLRAHVSAPDSLAWADDRRLLLMEAMPGRQWRDLTGARLADALGGLGAAVALLHEHAPTDGLPAFGRLHPDRLRRCADLVARARPDAARSATLLAARLVATAPEPAPAVALHGDCHPGNALVDGDHVALVDLDQMGTGPAAADLGSLVARLRYGAVVGELTAAQASDLETRFLTAYAEHRPLPAAPDLAWHAAAALLAERALRAVNRVNRTALAHLAELLATADATLDDGWLDLGGVP